MTEEVYIRQNTKVTFGPATLDVLLGFLSVKDMIDLGMIDINVGALTKYFDANPAAKDAYEALYEVKWGHKPVKDKTSPFLATRKVKDERDN